MNDYNDIEVTTIVLPRMAKGERSEFTVTVEDISVLSDIYTLGETWAFTMTMNGPKNSQFVSNVPKSEVTRERFEELRQHLNSLLGATKIKGFEDLYAD